MKSRLSQLILACLVCTAALVGYGILYRAVAAKSVAVTVLQDSIDAKTKVVSRMAITRSALAETSGDEAVVQNYFLSKTAIVAFIDSLEARARAIGVTTISVLSVSTGGTSAQPTFTFTLSIKGTFDAVMRTIGAIEYSPYAASISTLSVGQNAKNDWQASFTFLVGSSATTTSPNTL